MSTNEWTNEDGLTIRFGAEQATPSVPSPAQVVTFGAMSQMVVDVVHDNLPAETTDLDNDGTRDGWNDHDPYIPAKSYITRAYLICEEDWATADAATLDIGLSEKDGSVISADGLDVDIAAAALDLGDVVSLNGALVGGTVWTGTANAYVKAAQVTGTFTTGEAKLVIEYITTQV